MHTAAFFVEKEGIGEMIVILKRDPDENQLNSLKTWLVAQGLDIHESRGSNHMVLGLVGDTTVVDIDLLKALEIVDDVKRVQEPFKFVNRKMHPEDSVIRFATGAIGGGEFAVIAGPCSVESRDQMCTVAGQVKKSGAKLLRGGAFKPRTSPYSFQGLRDQGIELLVEAKRETGLPIVSEIMDYSQLPLFEDVDVIQIGARNMQNFELLKELGKTRKPILLKRGLANTLEELLMSAEYILAGGNEQVILCERGIRTFETATRNTLDLSAVALLKRMSHLPVIVDPSHSTGIAWMVAPMALAAVAAGADGLIIEVHNDPAHALCDGPQSLSPETFDGLMKKIEAIRPFAYKE